MMSAFDCGSKAAGSDKSTGSLVLRRMSGYARVSGCAFADLPVYAVTMTARRA
jgi:hypothetical protein